MGRSRFHPGLNHPPGVVQPGAPPCRGWLDVGPRRRLWSCNIPRWQGAKIYAGKWRTRRTPAPTKVFRHRFGDTGHVRVSVDPTGSPWCGPIAESPPKAIDPPGSVATGAQKRDTGSRLNDPQGSALTHHSGLMQRQRPSFARSGETGSTPSRSTCAVVRRVTMASRDDSVPNPHSTRPAASSAPVRRAGRSSVGRAPGIDVSASRGAHVTNGGRGFESRRFARRSGEDQAGDVVLGNGEAARQTTQITEGCSSGRPNRRHGQSARPKPGGRGFESRQSARR